MGSYLRDGLLDLQKKYPVIGDVRGLGLMQAMELVTDPVTKEPAPALAAEMLEAARERGLLIGKGGMYNNVLRMSPAMNIAKSDVDEALLILDQSFAAVTQPDSRLSCQITVTDALDGLTLRMPEGQH